MPKFNILLKAKKFSKSGNISTVLRPFGIDVAKLVENLQKEFDERKYPIGTKVVIQYHQNAFEEGYKIKKVMISSRILNHLGIEKGSANVNEIVGNVTTKDLQAIIDNRNREEDLSETLDGIWNQLCGQCYSMGLTLNGKCPKEQYSK